MTNLQTIAGGIVWAFTALVMIAAALEPVSVQQPTYQIASIDSSAARG